MGAVSLGKAKDKEERLLKRQLNRERMEEKRRLRAAQNEEQDRKRPRAKEARKEKKVLEKKVALSRQRKRDSDLMITHSSMTASFQKEDDRKKSDTESDSCDGRLILREQRRKKTDSEEKLPDKNRVHSFILDLELGTEERRKNTRKDPLSKEKERKEKERGVPDERLKHKLKTESRKSGDTPAEEKDGGTAKGAADEKKGSKVKPDRKSSVSSREGKTSVSEAVDEANLKKGKTAVNEREKPKGDSKLLRRLDSTGSSEERSEVETGSEVSRKKDKQPKEILKRSKSHPEAKPGEKTKVRTDRKDSSVDKTHPQKSGSETESEVRKAETGSKVKSLTEKHKSKPQNPTAGKSDKKTEAKSKPGTAEQKKEEKPKLVKKTSEKKVEKESESKSGEPLEPGAVSGSTPVPDDPYAALSDITPEPEDEDAVVREPRPLTAEADALLSLMGVHSSASELSVRRKRRPI
ncbi:biorientation of chromosomes in cell division protein 1-like 1 [Carassius auratus]|uniref:Biorientation of chromosomes in cell division protein 1-like 1 n=1 Tax=Carassius auratus TaxID=7957 RepID=A0A6P6N858_CARAU|nr:biorientation of chromosomes in cell division protein 1-like 1 [Carassius auratus]